MYLMNFILSLKKLNRLSSAIVCSVVFYIAASLLYFILNKLVDKVVEEMEKEGKKIVPLCPYAKALFDRKPEKYKSIEAE